MPKQSKPKRVKPSRPLLEVSPVLHAKLKDSAGTAGVHLKDFTGGLLEYGLSRWQSGALRIVPARVESADQLNLPMS